MGEKCSAAKVEDKLSGICGIGRTKGKSKPAPFENHKGMLHPNLSGGSLYAPPSMTLPALSRDTYSLRSAGGSFFSSPIRIFSLSFISTKARSVNPAVDSGSTNHLFGLPEGHHDSLFRRRDRSREQGAQSA